ncbi:uncharacterized protein LY89DRAFT_577473 [Mollisia scopiformis]|uniref:Zn(2)-C6 fungal-type domain-containing protein n=1 Tax=Mollisia scopiformis TaxID=149040 RepID=A0A194XMP0_MOLSC|nr:uncharacterized protein LY89DRAFT_577473 [Mollisia scopiformis]KUJ21359.1 hypothetical protein LY89DRAFT_577473 [Mollisia scopiformis]
MSLPRKACHNCRRRRLRCDRSLPQCYKCTSTGQDCLGYQALLFWNNGVASRGKMSGMTFEDMKQREVKKERLSPESLSSTSSPPSSNIELESVGNISGGASKLTPQPLLDHSSQLLVAKRKFPFADDIALPLGRHLTDPFLQDLNQDARFYISHFNSKVCKDLVIYDLPKQNPFRDLIPLATQHPALLNIIIANSALQLSNASQRSAVMSFNHQLRLMKGSTPHLQISPTSQSSTWYKDALIAKQRALGSLSSILNDVGSSDIDVTLGTILLFIEFELTDFGTKDWRLHMHGAIALINSMKEPYKLKHSNMSSLRRSLISSCLVYDALSSTFAQSNSSGPARYSASIVRSSLHYAEANNYLSFPAALLEAVLTAAQLLQTMHDHFPAKFTTTLEGNQLPPLLQAAQSFNVRDWASGLQRISPHCDLENRVHVASAHKAAVCIYICRVLRFLSPEAEAEDNLEPVVSDIITHLSFVTSDNELFKATSWPTFVAGAEARDLEQQAWAMTRLQQLRECLPCTMGYVRSAMEILDSIWRKRDAAVCAGMHNIGWIQELKLLEIDIMIA